MDTIWQVPLSVSDGPKYQAVADTIRRAIDGGVLEAGAKLPPVRELAYQLRITPGTVARAYTVLTQDGVLRGEVGRGTFVAPPEHPNSDDFRAQTPVGPEISAQLVPIAPVEAYNINLLSPALPDVGQVAAIQAALQQVTRSDPVGFLSYPSRNAYQGVREAVVEWLSDLPIGSLDQQDIVLTHGGQSGICVALQAIISGPRPVLLVEELSYAGFRRAGEILRAEVIGVQTDRHGVRPEALEAAARHSGAQVFCTTAEVQNPTGNHTPVERRKELVQVAERYDLQILEDDCYRMDHSRAPSYRALAPKRGWHVSSFSKTFTPSLRVGFAIAPQGRRADLRRVAEYGYFGLSYPLAELTRVLLSDPATRVLCQEVRRCMAEYVRVAVNALGGFDLVWDADVPFVWLNLPAGWRAAAFCLAAEGLGVQIRSADEFVLRNGRAPHAVRIAINAQVTLQSFENAMQRLRGLLDNPLEEINV